MGSKIEEGIDESSFRFSFGREDGKYGETMVTVHQKQLFGDFNVEHKIDESLYSMCFEDYSGTPVCFLCLNTYPWTLSVPPWDWEFWINKLYGLNMVNSWNALWIHLILWDQKYKYTFFLPLLQRFFARKPLIKYLILILPPNVKGMKWIDSHGIRIFPKDVETHNCQTLVLFTADAILPRYKIRQAVEEDNDDVVEIIKKDSLRLTEMYGDFYIAEILTTHRNSGRQIIVAEYDGVAVGVLVLNENVNLELLKHNFELTPLFNLRKFPDEEVDYLFNIFDQYPCGEMEGEDEQSKDEGHKSKRWSKTSYSVYTQAHSDVDSRSQTSSETSEEDVSLKDLVSLHVRDDASRSDLESLPSHCKDEVKPTDLDNYPEYYTPHLYIDEPNFLKAITKTKVTTCKDDKLPRTRLDTYIGECNAFVIEIVSAVEEHRQVVIPKLIATSYECFPNRDFALIAMNPQCFTPCFPEIFARLTPRPCHSFEDNVYFQHRDFFYAKPYVRQASMGDYDTIARAMQAMEHKEIFLEDFTEAVCDDDSPLSAYVLCIKSKVIGMIILQPFVDIEEVKRLYWIRGCYNEKVHKPYTFGMINNAIRSCAFSKFSTFFLIQVHRISDFSIIFHDVNYSDTEELKRTRFLNNLMEIMVPIRVKIMPEEINMPLTPEDRRFLNRKEPSLNEKPEKIVLVSTPQRIARPVYDVNYKIVIAGADSTAIAFLEGLLCTWSKECRLNYSNVTVIAPDDLNIDKEYHHSYLMFPRSNSFHEKWVNFIMIRSLVNYVPGEISAIDRKNKVIVVDDCAFLKYDVLMLACGEKFQRPGFNPRNVLQQPPHNYFPHNVFIVNDRSEGRRVLDKLLKLIEEAKNDPYSVIVYGNVLEAYCCLNALLAAGIPGKNLVFVDPPIDREESIIAAPMTKSIFDSNVLDAVRNSVSANDIRMHIDYNFENWDYDPLKKHITGARFKSKHFRIYEPCIAMFMYSYRTVSPQSFMAMNKAGLVFDGGLVIDNQYKTNDPYIYGAGSMTKYSRKYYADHLSHRYYNLEEVGHDFGMKINKAFMNAARKRIFMEEKTPLVCDDGDYIVRSFKKPIKMFCKLPRDLQYLCVTRPGKFVPSGNPEDTDEYGKDLETGDINDLSKQGYFKIHLNKYNHIETILCLTRFKLDKNNLFSIWGKHESLFNKLLLRYEMGLIKDFFEYFRQPWTYALYMSDFVDVLHKVRNTLFSHWDYSLGKPLGQYIIDTYRWNKWKKLPKEVKDEIDEEFLQTEYPELIKEQVIQFINNEALYMPMYFAPVNDTHLFFDDNEESPLFKAQ